MRRSPRLSTTLVLVAVMALSVGATSCGGGGGGSSSDLVLVGFNIPNIAGVALNQPLMFTFSADIDPSSITPDTLRVVGALGPNFSTTVVDGNLVALLPRSPNFEDYTDAGLLPGIRYTVSFATFPAPDTIRTPTGKPLLAAESFQFDTDPIPRFIETRRPIDEGAPPGDSLGCLNNGHNSLDTTAQFGSGPGARLLCLKNEGRPQVIWDECSPQHGDEAVGTPSITAGLVNLPALRVRFNEPLDPVSVVPWSTSTKWSENIELWRVGDTSKQPAVKFDQVRVNKPLIVQSLKQTELILVPANEDALGERVGGVPQGTYLINITRNIHDMNGNEAAIGESLPPGPFQAIDDEVTASPDIPDGYRIYFVSLIVPGESDIITEGYDDNLSEWGDAASGGDEPGVFTFSDLASDPQGTMARIPDTLLDPPGIDTPSFTLDGTWPGQSTTANWNNGFRFLNIPSLQANPDVGDATGLLQAVWRPHCGSGADGAWESRLASASGPVERVLNTSPVSGSSINGDGIYEFSSFILRDGDTLNVIGSQPLVILCRGDFTVEAGAKIVLNGGEGDPGLDTDGDTIYENVNSIRVGGLGGSSGAGGGDGGVGADPINDGSLAGNAGFAYEALFGAGDGTGAGQGGSSSPSGGGGAALAVAGLEGTFANGLTDINTPGVVNQDGQLRRNLGLFEPDRCYSPNAEGSGGNGGGGGGARDQGTTGTPENGDDGGGGGGGAGGGLYVIAGGEIVIDGEVLANGGDGGSTYARADQFEEDPDPDTAGDEYISGVDTTATPSGAGGPGGGGSGGAIFLCGINGVTVGTAGVLSADAGLGGTSGLTDPVGGTGTELVGGDGATGVIVLASQDTANIDDQGSSTPSVASVEYNPTVQYTSQGLSRWYDLVADTTQFVGFRWESNFPDLDALGLVQGVDFHAYLEVQGASLLIPSPSAGTPMTAQGLTAWITINADNAAENRVTFSAAAGDPSPIDGSRFFRYRWRFEVPDSYPGWPVGPVDAEELPRVLSLTVEYER